jgi:hypothetical protein
LDDATPDVSTPPFIVTPATSLCVGIAVSATDDTAFATDALYKVVVLAKAGVSCPALIESPVSEQSALACRRIVTTYCDMFTLSCAVTLTNTFMATPSVSANALLVEPDATAVLFTVIVALE